MKTSTNKFNSGYKQAGLLFLSIFYSCIFYGCGSAYLRSTTIRMEPIHCHDSKLPNQIYTFWESDKVDFPYRRLGLVEVYGNADSDFHDLNDNLLFQARSMCANAIIHVYQEPIFVWNSNTERHDKKTKMVGIAVRITENQEFMQQHKDKLNTGFVEELQEKHHIKGNEVASFFVNSFLLSALCLTIVFAVANDEE